MVANTRSPKRLFAGLGLTLLAALALSGIAVSPASASSFQTCKYNGEKHGSYEDSACSTHVKGGPNPYEWFDITTSTPFTLNGTTAFEIKTEKLWGGILVKVNCSTQTGKEGEIGKSVPSTFSATFAFEGCTTNLKNCTVSWGNPVLWPNGMGVAGEATEFKSQPAVKISPLYAGVDFTSINFSGEKCLLNNEELHLGGSFTGYFNVATSSVEFTPEGSALTLAGWPTTIKGTSKAVLSSGETLRVKP